MIHEIEDINFSIDVDSFLRWPTRILQIFGLWNETFEPTCRLMMSYILLFILVITTIINSVVTASDIKNSFIRNATFVALSASLVTYVYKNFVFLTRKREVLLLIRNNFCNISAPFHLKRYVKRYQTKCNDAIKGYYVQCVIIIIIIITLIAAFQKHGNDVTAVILTILLTLFALLHLQYFAFYFMQIAWLLLILNTLEHMNNVVQYLNCKPNSLGPKKLNEKHQRRIEKTLNYAIQTYQRASK
jgi:hypothetical protein